MVIARAARAAAALLCACAAVQAAPALDDAARVAAQGPQAVAVVHSAAVAVDDPVGGEAGDGMQAAAGAATTDVADGAAGGIARDAVAHSLQALAAALEWPRGLASWYGHRFHGRRTASGERFDMHDLTAAHPSLPFGTRVRVHSLTNGRSVEVRINDRGPFVRQRIIDLSRAAAEALGLLGAGTGTKQVAIEVLEPAAGATSGETAPPRTRASR